VQEFVADARTIAGIGVNIIGGCCGTTPEFIAGLRRAIRPRGEGAAPGEDAS